MYITALSNLSSIMDDSYFLPGNVHCLAVDANIIHSSSVGALLCWLKSVRRYACSKWDTSLLATQMVV